MIPTYVDGTLVTNHVGKEAQRRVRMAIRSAVYDTDAEGDPTDSILLAGVTEATEEVVRALVWRDREDEAAQASAALSPLGKPLTSAAIMGASYSVETGASLVPEPYRLSLNGGICSSAFDVLLEAGLLNCPIGILRG